jgi:hypothetical protein
MYSVYLCVHRDYTVAFARLATVASIVDARIEPALLQGQTAYEMLQMRAMAGIQLIERMSVYHILSGAQ